MKKLILFSIMLFVMNMITAQVLTLKANIVKQFDNYTDELIAEYEISQIIIIDLIDHR